MTKRLSIKLAGEEREVRVGIRLFNILNNFNPQDVQENLSSPFYGTFYRGVKRKIRALFEIGRTNETSPLSRAIVVVGERVVYKSANRSFTGNCMPGNSSTGR